MDSIPLIDKTTFTIESIIELAHQAGLPYQVLNYLLNRILLNLEVKVVAERKS